MFQARDLSEQSVPQQQALCKNTNNKQRGAQNEKILNCSLFFYAGSFEGYADLMLQINEAPCVFAAADPARCAFRAAHVQSSPGSPLCSC